MTNPADRHINPIQTMTDRCTETARPAPQGVRSVSPTRWIPRSLVVLAVIGASAPAPAQEFDTGPTDGLYSLSRSQDAIAELLDAREDLAGGDPAAAVERLQRLLDESGRGVVPTPGEVNRWNGLRLAVIRILRELPPAARDAYESLARRQAGSSYRAPLEELAQHQLRHLAEAFPVSRRGLDARLRLGDLALVDGDAITAQEHFRAARDAMPDGHPAAASLRERSRIADALARHAAGGALAPSGEPGALAELEAVLPVRGTPPWAAYGGGYDGSRTMTPLSGDAPTNYEIPILASGFDYNDFSMHAVGDVDGVFINDGQVVWAMDPVGQRVAWRFEGPVLGTEHARDAEDAINPDLILACAVDERYCIAALQVPQDVIGAGQTQRYRATISIIEKIPSRRLYCFDRETGKVLWTHFDYDGGPLAERYAGHDACGAPLIHGDTVLCATHDQTGAIAYYISAYDLRTGTERWRRLVCSSQQEVNMFGNARQEFAAGPIAVHGGVVFGTTNLGICYSVDLADGDLRWITEYPTIPLPRTELRDQQRRPVYFANNPIVITEGVLATTPLDSDHVVALDVETGARLWQMRFDEADRVIVRWLLGAIDGRFILSGLGLLSIDARPQPGNTAPDARIIASTEALRDNTYRTSSVPRGAVADNRIWLTTSGGELRVLDARGNHDPRMARLGTRFHGAGNLMMVDGVAATVRNGSVILWSDLDGLIQQARLALREEPGDPAALLRVATLEHALTEDPAGPRGQRTVDAYQAALQAARKKGLGAGSNLFQRIQSGLFRAAMDRADAISRSDLQLGLELFQQARDGAPAAADWLRAQVRILELTEHDHSRHLAELQRMADTHPAELWIFPEVGRVPVVVYARWAALDDLATPTEVVERAQALAERFGQVVLGADTVRSRCNARIEQLIARHGRAVYAPVEQRAAAALDAAGHEPEPLRALVDRYPQSEAASQATRLLLDLAVAAGDLATAAASFREAARAPTPPGPGILRRLSEAARRGGNPALYASIGTALRSARGSETSDFGPDEGLTYAALFADVTPPAPPAERPLELPRRSLARLSPPGRDQSLTIIDYQPAPGFPRPEHLPLFLGLGAQQLLGFDTAELPDSLSDRLFALEVDSLPRPSSGALHLCGEVLVIVNPDQIRGVRWADGEVLWRIATDSGGTYGGRSFAPLGVQSGVLHVFSHLAITSGDGGVLIGIEPTTGEELFQHWFDADRPSFPPVATQGTVWTLEVSNDQRSVSIRRHDPLTGQVRESTPVAPEILSWLKLSGPMSHRLRHRDVQSGFLVDEDRVYLPVDKGIPDEPARVVALERATGTLLWQFAGNPEQQLYGYGAVLAPHAVAFLERAGDGGRLRLLDRATGEIRGDFEFGPRVRARNWPDPRLGQELGDRLLLTEGTSATSLVSIDLSGGNRHFKQDYPQVNLIRPEPLQGPGFVLLPVHVNSRPTLFVTTADSRAAGALPGGERELTIDVQGSTRTLRHDDHVVVEAMEGILILGDR